MIFTPHTYQKRAIRFVEDHPYCALFVDMGLGKTVVTLSALRELQRDYFDVGRVLVIAPKSVALNTWSDECAKWDHTANTKVSVVMGSAQERRRALETEADLYVTNRDNVVWLVSQYVDLKRRKLLHRWPFDCVVLDESTSFKNTHTKRFRALVLVRPYIRRLILLTGTPAPNGLEDLWSQIGLLDYGERLGKHITQFRSEYFVPGARNGAVIYEYRPRPGAKEAITSKISDIVLTMRAEDYLDLPGTIDGGLTLQLENIAGYKQFERDCVAEVDGTTVSAVTAVALTNKLLQFSSGAVYDDEHNWHEVDSTKIGALADIIEASQGQPVLVYYNYKHELARLERDFKAVSFRGEPDLLRAWNRGEVPVMCAHPASVAFGLNMQAGGHIIVWYSPTWNLELYQQANARLVRQGQRHPVILYHLICKDTMDETVMRALSSKEDLQTSLMVRLKQIRDETALG